MLSSTVSICSNNIRYLGGFLELMDTMPTHEHTNTFLMNLMTISARMMEKDPDSIDVEPYVKHSPISPYKFSPYKFSPYKFSPYKFQNFKIPNFPYKQKIGNRQIPPQPNPKGPKSPPKHPKHPQKKPLPHHQTPLQRTRPQSRPKLRPPHPPSHEPPRHRKTHKPRRPKNSPRNDQHFPKFQ